MLTLEINAEVEVDEMAGYEAWAEEMEAESFMGAIANAQADRFGWEG